jgi:hypothetical protein
MRLNSHRNIAEIVVDRDASIVNEHIERVDLVDRLLNL